MRTRHWKEFQLYVNIFLQQTFNKREQKYFLFFSPVFKVNTFCLLPSVPCPVAFLLPFFRFFFLFLLSVCILLFIKLNSLLFGCISLHSISSAAWDIASVQTHLRWFTATAFTRGYLGHKCLFPGTSVTVKYKHSLVTVSSKINKNRKLTGLEIFISAVQRTLK